MATPASRNGLVKHSVLSSCYARPKARDVAPDIEGEDVDLVLRVEPKGGEPFSYRCEGPAVVLGRSVKADLRLPPDKFLSRRHARIFVKHGDWYLEDLGSQNRTLLNGQIVTEPKKLTTGDAIVISECRIHVEEMDEEAPVDSAGDGVVFRSARAILADSDAERLPPDSGREELERAASRLRLLHSVHEALATSITVDELLEIILDRAFAVLRPEEGTVYLQGPGGALYRAASRRLPQLRAEDYFFSERLAREVVDRRVAALVYDALEDDRFRDAQSFVGLGVQSVIAAPLLDPEGCSGMLILSSRSAVRAFSREDLELLVCLAYVAALRLKHIKLAEEAVRRRELELEVEHARKIQIALLPEGLPSLAGYSVYARNAPSRTVSGDLYRFEERPANDECSVLVADVSGKGLSASLLTASLEALSAGPMEMGRPPHDVLQKLSRRLHARTPPERFATAVVATLDASRHTVRYASAGHNPALWVRESSVVELDATGIPLGMFADAAYEVDEIVLAPGDALVIYTDGLTEATNAAGEDYGLDRLKRACLCARSAPIHVWGRAVDDDLEQFAAGEPFADDRTLVIMRRDG